MRHTTLLAILTVSLLTACATEERPVGPTEIRFDLPDRTKTAVHKIYRDDAHLGWLETYRIVDEDNDDRNDRELMYVLDAHHRRVGYITDDLRAYRLRAYDGRYAGRDIVARKDLGTNILGIFDYLDGEVRLERVTE